MKELLRMNMQVRSLQEDDIVKKTDSNTFKMKKQN